MSVQDILDKQYEEFHPIFNLITHPAGFIVDLFGGMLYIRPHCDGYEVGWKTFENGMECDWHKQFVHDEAQEAVMFFISKRHELQLGVDFESELMKENQA